MRKYLIFTLGIISIFIFLVGCNSSKYTVTFDSKGGNEISDIKDVLHGRTIDLRRPRKEGYEFIGWFIEGSEIDEQFFETTKVKSNLSLYAKWKDAEYEVVFVDYDGRVINKQKVQHGFSAIEPIAPSREGYSFIGWDKEFVEVQKKLKINAMYTKNLSIDSLKDKNTTITIKVRSGSVSAALEDLVDDFHKEFPYVDVEIDRHLGSYDDLRASTIFDINAGNQDKIPDLIIGYPDHFAEYYSMDVLVNLQNFINDPNVGYTSEELSDFLPTYLEENRGFDIESPDDLYGLPFNKSTEVMVYNKTAFKALFGENYLEKVPSTWNEVNSISKEILEKVKNGELDNTFVDAYNPETGIYTYLKVSDYLRDPENIRFIPFGYDSSDNAFITITKQFGAEYTERVNVSEGYVKFDNPESRTAMAYFQDMKNNGVFGVAGSFNAYYTTDAFKLIQVLMTVGSSAGVKYNEHAQYKYELGVTTIPYHNEDAKYVIQQGTNVGMLNHNTDEEKLASWIFIKYLLQPENTAAFAIATGGYLPVRTSAYETEAYSEYLVNPTLDKVAFSAAANVALNDYIEQGYKFFVDDAFMGSSNIREEAGRIFESIIVGNENIVDRYKEAYSALRTYVQKTN